MGRGHSFRRGEDDCRLRTVYQVADQVSELQGETTVESVPKRLMLNGAAVYEVAALDGVLITTEASATKLHTHADE